MIGDYRWFEILIEIEEKAFARYTLDDIADITLVEPL